MSIDRKDLRLSLVEFIRAHGHDSLQEFFADEKWNDFASVLRTHLEDARDMLEIETNWENIRYAQGQVNALRTILDLADITVEVGKEMSLEVSEEKPEEEENERRIDNESII